MDVVVCIKQVPATTEIKVDPKTNTLIREGIESTINPFDAYALEEGLRIKEKYGGRVTAISMGPPQAEAILKDAIAVGADKAILLSDQAFAGADTLATSYALFKAIQKIGSYDVIICGKQTLDGDTGQVGPELAEHLAVSCLTFVRKIDDISKGLIKVERLVEEGYELVQTTLPCVITVVKEINEPRLPSLRGMMAAKKAEIPVWTASDIKAEPEKIGMDGSPTEVLKVFTPKREVKAEIFAGEVASQVKELVDRLKKARVI